MSLSITVSEGGGGGAWENAPTGIFKATCCDVIDLGRQETEHGNKHQCEIHFELEKETAGLVEATGNQFTVRTQRYNLPEPGHQLHEKSSLHKFLSAWRGKTLTPGDDIDLGKLVGVHAHLVLAMKVSQKTGSEYTAITTASPKNKNEVFPPLSGAYTRRVMEAAPVAAPAIQAPAPAAAPAQPAPVQPAPAPAENLNEDDVPF